MGSGRGQPECPPTPTLSQHVQPSFLGLLCSDRAGNSSRDLSWLFSSLPGAEAMVSKVGLLQGFTMLQCTVSRGPLTPEAPKGLFQGLPRSLVPLGRVQVPTRPCEGMPKSLTLSPGKSVFFRLWHFLQLLWKFKSARKK